MSHLVLVIGLVNVHFKQMMPGSDSDYLGFGIFLIGAVGLAWEQTSHDVEKL